MNLFLFLKSPAYFFISYKSIAFSASHSMSTDCQSSSNNLAGSELPCSVNHAKLVRILSEVINVGPVYSIMGYFFKLCGPCYFCV